MQIIVIPRRLGTVRTLSVSARHLLAVSALAFLLLVGMTLGMYWFTIRFAADADLPVLHELVLAAQKSEMRQARERTQHNLNGMAVKLGEMQAQITRVDALGQELSRFSGLNARDLHVGRALGLGGATSAMTPAHQLSLAEFEDKLLELSQRVEGRTDMYGVLESKILEQAVERKLVPSVMPVHARMNSSGFGQRIDPFTGLWSMHEGIDFIADIGAPVTAAAAGVVIFAGFHPAYGNMVDIDHGNDFVSRYAHASRLSVKEGDVVQRGTRIAEVGSTGRSTGPHLHFEVRFKGSAQNPSRYLYAGTRGTNAVTATGGPLTRPAPQP